MEGESLEKKKGRSVEVTHSTPEEEYRISSSDTIVQNREEKLQIIAAEKLLLFWLRRYGVVSVLGGLSDLHRHSLEWHLFI